MLNQGITIELSKVSQLLIRLLNENLLKGLTEPSLLMAWQVEVAAAEAVTMEVRVVCVWAWK